MDLSWLFAYWVHGVVERNIWDFFRPPETDNPLNVSPHLPTKSEGEDTRSVEGISSCLHHNSGNDDFGRPTVLQN